MSYQYFYGLFTNLLVEFLTLLGDYSEALFKVNATLKHYEKLFQTSLLAKNDEENCLKVYVIGRIYQLICMKNLKVKESEVLERQIRLRQYCTNTFMGDKSFQEWLLQTINSKASLKEMDG